MDTVKKIKRNHVRVVPFGTKKPTKKKEWYQVREVVRYELKATSVDDALNQIMFRKDRDKFCIEVEEREAWKT